MKPELGAALMGVLAVLALSWPLASVSMAGDPPEPSVVPTRWELDLEVGPMRVITLNVPDEGERSFYYVTYLVTNDSGEDVFFAPMFELATDQGEMIAAGRNVPRWVSQELLRRLRNPLLEDQINIIGQLQQGPEYAKEGLAVWAVGETDVDELTVHFIGFSGESKTVNSRDAETGEIREVVLRKTFMKPYRAPGRLLDERAESEGGRRLMPQRGRWIMREPGTIIASDIEKREQMQKKSNSGGTEISER